MRGCQLHAHLAYIFGNLPPEEFTVDIVTQLIASNIFLTTRYVFDLAAENGAMYKRLDPEKRGLESGLGVPDTEMFDLFQNRRAYLLEWLDADPQRANAALEGVVNIITMGDEVPFARIHVSFTLFHYGTHSRVYSFQNFAASPPVTEPTALLCRRSTNSRGSSSP